MVALPNSIVIGSRHVGDTNPCFIIAEAGVNHNGSVERAHALIEAAADAGVDAVKFQSFVTEELVTRDAPKAAYQLGTTDSRQSQFDMLKALELSVESQLELQRHCAERRVEFLSTPYDTVSVSALATMRVAAYKIASTDATNVPELRTIAAQGRPVLVSTGTCTIGEV